MSTERKNIAAKLVAAMGDIDAVTKEGKNETQGYKYVKAADVAQEVRKVLVKHKIAFTFSIAKAEHWATDRFDRQGTVIGHMNYVELMVDFAFVDSDSGEVWGLTGIGWGADTGEKAPYKAMTGALKYALRMNFIIPDESDPENEKAEVFAEVERQKANPTKGDPTAPQSGPRLTAALQGSVDIKVEAEKRAAQERNKLAEQQGIFSLDGDVLSCKIVGIQKKQSKATPTKESREFRSVTFNGRLPNGANFASCFDTVLWDSLDACLDKTCQIKIEVKGAYANVVDVIATSIPTGPVPFMAGADDIPF